MLGDDLRHARGRLELVTLVVPAAMVLIGVLSLLLWSGRHPLGTSWDESFYVNRVIQDVHEADTRGLWQATKLVRWTDRERPPAYRVVGFLAAEGLGASPQALRIASLAGLLVAAVLLGLATRTVAAPGIAMFASAAFVLSYAPLWAAAHFGTEAVLYPAIAGLYWALVYAATGDPGTGRALTLWVGIAAATALGALSKITFFAVAGPAVLVFLAAAWLARLPRRMLWLVGTASGVGLLLTLPWWGANYRQALAFARSSSHFFRHGFPWLHEAFWRLLGPPLGVLVVVLLAGMVLLRKRLGWALSRSGTESSRVALAVCVAGALPLIIAHVASPNHMMRLLSPALIPAMLATAIIVHAAGMFRTRAAVLVATSAIVLQAAYMVRHFATSQIDQWDWEPLLALGDQRGLRDPIIEHLGGGITFTPPAIAYPWIRRGRSVTERWLWRLEDGPIDWPSVMKEVEDADIVVTAPNFMGDDVGGQEDNQYNAELAARLEQSPGFAGPAELRLGRFHTRVLAFFRKRRPVP